MAITRYASPQPSSCSTVWGPGASLPAQAGRMGTGLGRGHREGKTKGNDSARHPRCKPGPGDPERGHVLSRQCPQVPAMRPRRCPGALCQVTKGMCLSGRVTWHLPCTAPPGSQCPEVSRNSTATGMLAA